MRYTILAVLSLCGLVASILCHLLGWLHIDPPGSETVFLLHIGIFVVFFPLVIYANQTMPKPYTKGNLSHLYAELPSWARIATYALFVYAIVHFFYVGSELRQFPQNKAPLYLRVRGFSGHWMLLYGWSLAGFVGLARYSKKKAMSPEVAEPVAAPDDHPRLRAGGRQVSFLLGGLMNEVLGELVSALEIHGFREVARPSESVPDAQALLRRQTLLTNQAVVVVSPGIAACGIDPAQHVSRVDNQWAIIQSIFLVDPDAGNFRSGRTWGQVITGKYQDAIEEVLKARFRALGAEATV